MIRSRRVRALLVVAATTATLAAMSGLAGAAGASPGAGPNRYSTVPIRSAHLGGQPTRYSTPGYPYFRSTKNLNLTNEPGAQSETAIAVDPTNPKHAIASVNDLTTTAAVYETTNGGKTWTLQNLGLGSAFCYDTWDDFNSAGDAFVSLECSDQRIAYQKAGTQTWVTTLLPNAGIFPDRDMVRVDTSTSSSYPGSVYIGYDDNGANNAAYVMYSRDGFGNWQRSAKINDTSSTIGVNVATAPNGTVYAAWEDFSGGKIWVDRSTDGGATWSTDHVVTTYRLATQSFFILIPPTPHRGIVPFPMTAVSPAGTAHAGRLYVAYTDKSTTGSDTDIFVRYSDDGGATWSAESRVNDDTVGAYQFFPSISVSANGTVAVSFYDTRNDPTNHKTDRYIAFSTDGGVTWSANQKVTTAMSDETGANANPNDYGDYENMDSFGKQLFALDWTDSRAGAQAEDMFAAGAKP